jgi:hypothetical protein
MSHQAFSVIQIQLCGVGDPRKGCPSTALVGKKNTTLEYSTRVVQEGDRRCEKSTLNDLAYLTPLRIPLMNPVHMIQPYATTTVQTGFYSPLYAVPVLSAFLWSGYESNVRKYF